MIEIGPRDRPVYLAKRQRSIGGTIVVISLLCVFLGVGFVYWKISSTYSDAYKQLNTPALPLRVEVQPRFYDLISQLSREPCYKEAVVGLSDALLDSGYPRESATFLLAFAQRCGATGDDSIMVRAYRDFRKIGDLAAALRIIDQLVNSDPADPDYRYSRGTTYEQIGISLKH
jgi:hypothetical protein